MKGSNNVFLIFSIAFGFFLLSWISSEIKLSSFFILACSLFVVFFSMGDLLHQSIEDYTGKWSRRFGFFGIGVFYILSIPISIMVGFSYWIVRPDEDTIGKMSDSFTFISIGLLFISFALKTIKTNKTEESDI
ncbi:hypothetical protein [Metabacillus fastidiosus]|uniref:Uncharacterized protein n=1 Tax=Metabacillus fastidiosus TaxID=1458 RepID=A0ABU6NW58_9BACI|nr:hypothetical protein [Metabacillus fastidiosus]MED4401361.1 hypothetical protein [Metabacillus fastidiosus]MED4462998.1 hypothetical protein [Metabacillus fastidiosus]